MERVENGEEKKKNCKMEGGKSFKMRIGLFVVVVVLFCFLFAFHFSK